MTAYRSPPIVRRDAKPPRASWWRVFVACVFRSLMYRLDARERRRVERANRELFRPVREARRRAFRKRLDDHGAETPHVDCELCDLLRHVRRIARA